MLSNENTIIINQPAGLGDIIFIQTILIGFVDKGYKVVLPVVSCYENIAKHFPRIEIIDKAKLNIDYNSRTKIIKGNTKIIPLRFSDSICKVPYRDCMKSKYIYFGLNWMDWKKDCRIVRDYNAEDNLFYNVLGLKDGEEYNLISESFTTSFNIKVPIKIDNGLKNIFVTQIKEFTLIDWLKVYQNATNIHAVSSSNIYLFELFELKAKEVHLYIRKPQEKNHDNYSYLLTKNYILHD